MVSFAVCLSAGIAVLAVLSWCGVRGLRDGDRPGDATIRAVLRDAGQPGESRPVIVATVANPSDAPAIAGLSARPVRLPGWLAAAAHPLIVSVPRRTARARFRPARYATVGVVPSSGTARFAVPVGRAARRYVLTAAIGQGGGRLRLYRLRVAGDPQAVRTELTV